MNLGSATLTSAADVDIYPATCSSALSSQGTNLGGDDPSAGV